MVFCHIRNLLKDGYKILNGRCCLMGLKKSFCNCFTDVFTGKPSFKKDDCVFISVPFAQVVLVNVTAFFQKDFD